MSDPTQLIPSITEVTEGSPYVSYAYSYPHKTSYRPLSEPLPLCDVWTLEDRISLFLYIHIPFCEFRCGFCNLFTYSQPQGDFVEAYLNQLAIQARIVRDTIPDARFARVAIGGGTPTYLSTPEIERLFAMISETFEIDLNTIPVSCEASPATIDSEKLELLRSVGVDRLSLGVQSFLEPEAQRMGRPQRSENVHRAVEQICLTNFPIMNLDLIYGAEGQTTESWLSSINQAIQYQAEEIYLYPLYVRQLTGLGKRKNAAPVSDWDQQRLELYRVGRDHLLEHGYEQVSMRMFRLKTASETAGPIYCCQEDGMIGLGCGARSYTSELHYSYEYAVRSQSILAILQDYNKLTAQDFQSVTFGFRLDQQEQKRRFLILSLLQKSGLQRSEYRSKFSSDVMLDFPELKQLEDADLASISNSDIRLTAIGLERSDAIGPWLTSSTVKSLMEDYTWR